jgi:hypothetical protein
MAIKYELIANGGTYTNKDGQEKKRWIKCGIVVETERGMSAKIESLPVNFDGWLMMSEPREKPTHGGDDTAPF